MLSVFHWWNIILYASIYFLWVSCQAPELISLNHLFYLFLNILSFLLEYVFCHFHVETPNSLEVLLRYFPIHITSCCSVNDMVYSYTPRGKTISNHYISTTILVFFFFYCWDGVSSVIHNAILFLFFLISAWLELFLKRTSIYISCSNIILLQNYKNSLTW